MKKIFSLLFLFAFILLGCSSDDDNGIENPNPNPVTSADFPAQNFMWNAMNLWYFWQEDVPDLADDRFSTSQEYTTFLSSESDPGRFFFLICNQHVEIVGDQAAIDRFSFRRSNYEDLVNSLSGVSRSNGLEFGVSRITPDSDNLFGFVYYVIPESDAASQDITRGEFFTTVDGTQLTASNFRQLLFGENVTYTLGMADLENDGFTLNGKEVTLTKIENFVENPIQVATTLDVNGTKVAYLMYNRFLSSFNEELNEVFGQFIADGATELVLDMRYNPGGSVNTSRLLASMVHSTDSDKLYVRERWNSKIQPQLSPQNLESRFTDRISESNPTPINSLGLSKVYILTTNDSASASELVINGLTPHMEIIQIGETTRGKNEFSITLVDDPQGSFIYNPDRENFINPDSQWGLQPLVGRNENALGFFDYTDGLAPNIELEEDLLNLGTLGDVNEPLLARALQEINGAIARKTFDVKMPALMMTSSRLETNLKDNMFLDRPIHFKQD
ncbi:S41 family peptidase [Flagellimonas meridianipacifica]|uniref:C-terminal processing protease CtpA/Prc n=1 Tax=Flagellimonas meridianipacifica TaxID=1080225 RepID=A0A2T0MA65_9FLAO|nr:S41 family peptidase [Allomuricauda pacifica]PRX54426.1 C-terminal processing protease CtpA/Prc [Allomuricauda pacifica]